MKQRGLLKPPEERRGWGAGGAWQKTAGQKSPHLPAACKEMLSLHGACGNQGGGGEERRGREGRGISVEAANPIGFRAVTGSLSPPSLQLACVWM